MACIPRLNLAYLDQAAFDQEALSQYVDKSKQYKSLFS
jgi:hypothetical protein